MAARTAIAVALLAGTAEPLTREDRSLPPALPVPENYNSTLGWPVLDFSGAHLDAPLPTPHSSTRLHKRNISSTMRRRRLQAPDAHQGGLTPLFMGIGTHYAHVYVGTPAQRVSVIVDTGSHHTAFPCAGCKSCGKHTDPYFEPSRSSTLVRLDCSKCVAAARCVAKTCQVSQSYTEGSSWKAVQMKDNYYVGGDDASAPPRAGEKWIATPFVFGCQTYETGLFRTQKADGIMGMSMHAQTLVPTMRSANKLGHNSFAMCFMQGGGTMALGGVDTRIHKEPMQFVPLAKNSGWFTVQLKDVLLNGKSIGVPESTWNTGKGTIVDSGTTDTYLPRRAAEQFKRAWHAAMGPSPKYANSKLAYTAAQAAKFPTITYVFAGGVKVDVEGKAYMEKAGAGRWVPRVYLTEASGTVLGANFMEDHDCFFDAERRRVGFARADCDYHSLK
jgi:hypothetical protein